MIDEIEMNLKIVDMIEILNRLNLKFKNLFLSKISLFKNDLILRIFNQFQFRHC